MDRMISLRCPCGEIYHADERHIGKFIECRSCHRRLLIQAVGTSDRDRIRRDNWPPLHTSRQSARFAESSSFFVRVLSNKFALYAFGIFVLIVLGSTLLTMHQPPVQPTSISSRSSPYEQMTRPETIPPPATNPPGRAMQNEEPTQFSIGFVDSRFGVSRDRLLTLANEAKSLWEKEVAGSCFNTIPVQCCRLI